MSPYFRPFFTRLVALCCVLTLVFSSVPLTYALDEGGSSNSDADATGGGSSGGSDGVSGGGGSDGFGGGGGSDGFGGDGGSDGFGGGDGISGGGGSDFGGSDPGSDGLGGGSYGGSDSGTTGFEGSPEVGPGGNNGSAGSPGFGGGDGSGGSGGSTGFEGSPEVGPSGNNGSAGTPGFGGGGSGGNDSSSNGGFDVTGFFSGSLSNNTPDVTVSQAHANDVLGQVVDAFGDLGIISTPGLLGVDYADPEADVTSNPVGLGNPFGLDLSGLGAPSFLGDDFFGPDVNETPNPSVFSPDPMGPVGSFNINAPIGPANTFTPTELGSYVTLDTMPTTPATDFAMGKTSIGAIPPDMQQEAQARGFELTEETVAALAIAHEIDAKTRDAIIAAYQENPDLSTLNTAYVEEAAAFLNAIANEAANRGRTIAEQINVEAYLSSVTVDEEAYNTLADDATREALTELAAQLTDGTMANRHGLDVATPAPTANHFHAEYANPDWSTQLTDVVVVGPFTGSITGVIRGETNPEEEGARNVLGRSPDLLSPESLFSVDVSGRMVPATNGLGAPSPTSPTITVTDFANTFADQFSANNSLSMDYLGGIGLDNTVPSIPAGTFTPAPVSPSLMEAFTAAGINREEAEAIIQGVDLSVNMDVVGGQQNVPTVSISAPTITIEVSRTVAEISPETGYRSNIDFGPNAHEEEMTEDARNILNDVASKVDFTVPVINGYRSPEHNNRVNGAPKSQHLHANAWDISTQGLTSQQKDQLAKAIESTLDPNKNAWGLYANSVHIDARSSKAGWGPTYSSNSIELGRTLQPEMADEHANWTAGNNIVTAAYDTVNTVVTLSEEEFAGLQEINEAFETANPSSPDTSNPPEDEAMPPTNEPQNNQNSVPGVINTVTGFLNGITETARDGVGNIFDFFFSRDNSGGTQPDLNDDGAATTTSTSFKTSMGHGASAGLVATVQAAEHGEGSTFMGSLSTAIHNLFAWLFGDQKETIDSYATFSVESTNPSSHPYIPIYIQIDVTTGAVTMVRGLPQNTVNMETEDGLGEDAQGIASPDTALLFDQDGYILYSDGTYAPPYQNGQLIENGFDYVYFIEKIENGRVISTETRSSILPGNALSRTFSRMFTDNSPFTLNDVENVTYVYVDTDSKTVGNEYKTYTITLTDGSVRKISLPETSSLTFYSAALEQIGYTGDVFALVNLGIETDRQVLEADPGLFDRIVSSITDMFSASDGSNDSPFTDLTSIDVETVDSPSYSPLMNANLISALIYLDVPIACPQIQGFTEGYVYEVIVDLPNNDKNGVIYSAMCGTGTAEVYAQEVANDLKEQGYFSELSEDMVYKNLLFRFYDSSVNNPVTVTEEPAIPNTSNEISFEAKVTNSNGSVVRDWATGALSLQTGQQLHLRWNAESYRRCLPFIADNGEYSLTRADLKMISGNTESERYDLFERTGTYRLECDGQDNGEDGVDERTINVIVE